MYLARRWRWPILAAVVLSAAALVLAPILFAKLTAERNARQQVVAQQIDFNCSTNNGQDKLLARLVAASIGPQGTFGEDLDPSTLTPFDLQVLATIAKITAASTDTPLTHRFQQVLAKLRDLTDCQALVNAYLAGDSITTARSPVDAVGTAVRHGLRP